MPGAQVTKSHLLSKPKIGAKVYIKPCTLATTPGARGNKHHLFLKLKMGAEVLIKPSPNEANN
jgi:hypothetical protein